MSEAERDGDGMSQPIEFSSVIYPISESALRGGRSAVSLWSCGLCGCLVANVYAHTGFHTSRGEA